MSTVPPCSAIRRFPEMRPPPKSSSIQCPDFRQQNPSILGVPPIGNHQFPTPKFFRPSPKSPAHPHLRRQASEEPQRLMRLAQLDVAAEVQNVILGAQRGLRGMGRAITAMNDEKPLKKRYKTQYLCIYYIIHRCVYIYIHTCII